MPAGASQPQARKRGPKTRISDAELVEEIRAVLKKSPFLGEGHKKVTLRLRHRGIHVGKNRVLRLMREHRLLAPVRQRHVVPSRRTRMRLQRQKRWVYESWS
jgi:thiamine monophosphate synthase